MEYTILECKKCHYKKAKSQIELEDHFKKIHWKADRGDKNRQSFLLTFFPVYEGYEEIQVNGYWLIKSYNRDNDKWQVAIYSPSAYSYYKMTSNKETRDREVV